MFIRGTNENEIIEIVKSFKSKRSTDSNDIDMFIIKNIIECVVKPDTYLQSIFKKGNIS